MTITTRLASGGLIALSGLHLVWTTGFTWPLRDAGEFSELVAGLTDAEPPPPSACVAVAGLLGTAAALVAGRPHRVPTVSRLGSAGVVAVLALRGGLGLAGRTDLLSPGATSERFRALDRRYYGPLCLGLAAAALPAVRRSSDTAR